MTVAAVWGEIQFICMIDWQKESEAHQLIRVL
jgi:hypothetical protein